MPHSTAPLSVTYTYTRLAAVRVIFLADQGQKGWALLVEIGFDDARQAIPFSIAIHSGMGSTRKAIHSSPRQKSDNVSLTHVPPTPTSKTIAGGDYRGAGQSDSAIFYEIQ
jgi:hypothetical protein